MAASSSNSGGGGGGGGIDTGAPPLLSASSMEWTTILKPFLPSAAAKSATLAEGAATRAELLELCSGIIKSESEILRQHKEANRNLFNSLTILVADYISTHIKSLTAVSQLETVNAACRVLLKYFVNALQQAANEGGTTSATQQQQQHHQQQIERYLNAIKALCCHSNGGSDSSAANGGQGGKVFANADVSVLVEAIMKDDSALQHQQTEKSQQATIDKESNQQQALEGVSTSSGSSIATLKSRSDLSTLIFEQLTLPLRDDQSGTVNLLSQTTNESNNDDSFVEIKKHFLRTNTESLQSLRAGDILLEVCLSLPNLKKSKQRIDEALVSGKAAATALSANNAAEALLLRQQLSNTNVELKLAMAAVNLPILEPLTPVKLEKLCSLSMAILNCAVMHCQTPSGAPGASNIPSTGSSASPKAKEAVLVSEDAAEGAVILVEEALNFYNYIGGVVKSSTRAGGHVYQNFQLAGAWVLISGLQNHLAAVKDTINDKPTGKEEKKQRQAATAPSSGLQKYQQSFGVLSVALASKSLSLMTALFDDLHLEVCGGGGSASTIVQVEPVFMSTSSGAVGQFTALQRAARLLSAAPLNQLLFYLAMVSYRKACTLKLQQVQQQQQRHLATGPDNDNPQVSSQSDSTTYYEDMILCSESSTDEDDDDDSEPILGQWFEETLAPPDAQTETTKEDNEKDNSKQHVSSTHSVLPEKGSEAAGYLSLATTIFHFLNRHFLQSKSAYILRYVKSGLSEQQMIILAAIIRDLDREMTVRSTSNNNNELLASFSAALMRFTHNLVTGSHFHFLHPCLLNHLGVNPWDSTAANNSAVWPLQVLPRTLSVLSQVLLLRPQNEKEASIISIWHRLVTTLIDNVLDNNSGSGSTSNAALQGPTGDDDLNVEHAQVLLYLFHSLNLLQKKSVILLMAGGVLRCSELPGRDNISDYQLLHLSRLLLLFDYIVKHLYDAPTSLLEQIQYNLFVATNLSEGGAQKVWPAFADIEDHYFKGSNGAIVDELKPRFYIITSLDINNQDAPKLDGLACNFLLGTPDKLRYPLLLDALIEILNITQAVAGNKLSRLGYCAVQYCFTICWKLLQLLPPSGSYLEQLANGSGDLLFSSQLLHTLIWAPRTAHKNFQRWLKDCLVKQGMYTLPAERLLKAASTAVNNLSYDINVVNVSLEFVLKNDGGNEEEDIKKLETVAVPEFWHLYLLHAVFAKLEVDLEGTGDNTETKDDDLNISNAVQDLIPNILHLIRLILNCIRNNVGETVNLHHILAISSKQNGLTSNLAGELTTLLPGGVTSKLQQWNNYTMEEIIPGAYQNEIIPSESYILRIIESHLTNLSRCQPFNIQPSLKHLLHFLVRFLCKQAPKIDNTDTKSKAIELLVALMLDIRTEYCYDTVSKTLEKMIGGNETDEHQKRVYLHILYHTYELIIKSTSNNSINEMILHQFFKFYERIIEKSSGRQAMKQFFDGERHDLVKVLLSVSQWRHSQIYSTKVLHFFNKLFQAAEKSSTDSSLNYLCLSMSKLSLIDEKQLQDWLRHIIIGTVATGATVNVSNEGMVDKKRRTKSRTKKESEETKKDEDNDENNSDEQQEIKKTIQENSQLLQALTTFIVKQNVSEDVALSILKCLIPLGMDVLNPPLSGAGFSELMLVMQTLADANSGRGHCYLFPAASDWIRLVNNKSDMDLDASCCILSYLSDVIGLVTNDLTSQRAMSPTWDNMDDLDSSTDYYLTDDGGGGVGVSSGGATADNLLDEESGGEESDEDSLCNKLCTFTVTQREFMNQHWYHCHTCQMLDGVGVCSICARVCHRGHDLSYAKYGNFFCDCGAKQDGSCQALTKRTAAVVNNEDNSQQVAQQQQQQQRRGHRRRSLSPTQQISSKTGDSKEDKMSMQLTRKRQPLVKQIEGAREFLLNYLSSSNMPKHLLDYAQTVLPLIEKNSAENSPIGCHFRALDALNQLHTKEKEISFSDQLMVPTLGSQEGAFENVRMSYAGEQGQTIRQLLSAHIVRRVAMCCMSSSLVPGQTNRRQHLAVSHEKGKITVLQLAALLKQADSATRKLTLTRLSSAPVPFTVISLSSNPCNEDYLAVCGLKDCHVLTFNASGSVSDHLVLHPQLESGNFIIKAVWLPGSQTKLALVTADFIKIYDLSMDALSPQYYFLVPTGKVRDCTFMYDTETDEKNNIYHILIMSSPGQIYTELLNEETSAQHGSFYVTNTLEVFHLDATADSASGQIAGGGVSIYYSHTLKLLFYSYVHGKSFISPIKPNDNCLQVVFQINLPSVASSNGNGSKSSSNGKASSSSQQPLVQWTEIANHPGLVCCAMQSSNNPVILMLKPDSIVVQEVRVVPSKSKIMDMVAIRHSSGNEMRTTLILLCEDGSLKMYMANMAQTGYWMSSRIQPTIHQLPMKNRKRKIVKTNLSGSNSKNNAAGNNSGNSATVTFPVDFFEHCQQMNDVEFGGNDLLQIYNHAQLKHRLNTTGLYVACNRPLGFTMEITNNDANMVMTGIRVLVGNQDVQRAPSFVEVFGRFISISVTRGRWYDIPFSREESLQADKKLSIVFGPSQDPETLTMVDSVKVYGKTKDNFGWPEDDSESQVNNTNANSSGANNAAITGGNSTDIDNVQSDNLNQSSISKLEQLTISILEGLEGVTSILSANNKKEETHFDSASSQIATKLLTLPTTPSIQVHAKALLSSLYTNRSIYHDFKDEALLKHVLACLDEMQNTCKDKDIDAENYYRLVLIVRNIAVNRPNNLLKFTETNCSIDKNDKSTHLLVQLMTILWILHSKSPVNMHLSPVVVPGLKHAEQVVQALVEIVHAFSSAAVDSNNSNSALSALTTDVYLQLLLSKDTQIAFSAKAALSRVLKPKIRRRRGRSPSPPPPPPPPPPPTDTDSKTNIPASSSNQSASNYEVDEAINLLGAQGAAAAAAAANDNNVNALEALLGGGLGLPPILDVPMPDPDDDAMVELAIALSLQQDMNEAPQQAIDNANRAGVAETGHYSDTTASAAGSDDDEGSTAATDGSTLRTSPTVADQAGHAAASDDSGGSGVESIGTGEYHNVSGRSSAYGDTNLPEGSSTTGGGVGGGSSSIAAASATPSTNIASSNLAPTNSGESLQTDDEQNDENSRLHALRLQLLEKLVEHLMKWNHTIQDIDGMRSIPFLQVVLQLTTDLDGSLERDRQCLNRLLTVIIDKLQLMNGNVNFDDLIQRTQMREVQLVLMRLLSVFMSRCKSINNSQGSQIKSDNSNFVSRTTATALHKAGIIGFCNKLLQSLLSYWKTINGGTANADESTGTIGGNLLKPHLINSPPDMTPFFLKQFVKEHAHDIFSTYPQLLTEMALRLPYQVHKHSDIAEAVNEAFDSSWYHYLCEYMMTSHTPFVRRQVRKLLLFICGNKEKYRQLRDLHALSAHMKGVNDCCMRAGYLKDADLQHSLFLPYDALVELVEHLKACLEIAVSRTGNWQRYCVNNTDTIAFLIKISCLLDEGVSANVLHLLQCAIVVTGSNRKDLTKKDRKEREKSDDSVNEAAAFEESSCSILVNQINRDISNEIMARFIKSFMLETNTTSIRWQAHALILAIYRNSNKDDQKALLELLWQLWPLLPAYGRKAAQFVDLLGYFSLKYAQSTNDDDTCSEYVEKAVAVLQQQNQLLSHHPNANLYAQMSQFVELDGYYLESEPCLVCNNPEVPFSTIKLSSIKVDSKFTTTTQIVKLLSSHTISKITVRIGDLKRTKMVRTINIYYNNRSVQAVVELKNKPALWHKARKVTIASGATEVKIEFPLPIVACNLMIEYADFYENIQASSETLQCPRCSASVPANPGVCANCGENVFQCHKCRAINYDEKDPFLCHACGFCKYAKFDFTLVARPTCAVEPIENDEDRKKTVANINSLLEKADRVYKQLISNKPTLEALLLKISDHKTGDSTSNGIAINSSSNNNTNNNNGAATAAAVAPSTLKVNKTIQMLAQQYCAECKASFEELSKIIQRVLISRKELVAYDRKHLRDLDQDNKSTNLPPKKLLLAPDLQQNQPVNIRCYGCAVSSIEHCLTLLRALATNPPTRQILCNRGLIQELVWSNLRRGNVQTQEEVRQLLCLLTRDNPQATEELCQLLTERIMLSLNGHFVNGGCDLTTSGGGVRHEIALLAAMVQKDDECWELKLRCMMRLFLRACDDFKSPMVMDAVILPCLKILHNLMKPPPSQVAPSSSSSSINDKKDQSSAGVHYRPGQISVDVYKWLEKDRNHSFSTWQSRCKSLKYFNNSVAPTNKTLARQLYLSEKYARRWRQNIRKRTENTELKLPKLEFDDPAWLKAVLFNPSSRLARQMACNIIELMCNSTINPPERKRSILVLLTCFLEELGTAGESSAEFLALYQSLIQEVPWKQFLTLQGVLLVLADLVTSEIEQLHRLEETTLTSDLTQGYALNQLTELLSSFLEDVAIRRQYKSRLVGAVLNGYLSLRRLVVQRTRLIDETQEKLLELLEDMTTGTEEETKAFMRVCIATVDKYSLQDILTPVFVFERLCSIIYPEENDIGEFFLTLEKDPQQEDFLQGRMLGNPYSSLEPDLGPLMRDVKNKICQDCELVALLEDDNGMELLVNNKIINLDLPVKEVYKKVWLAEGGDHDSMRVIYRMRGLLGDATEEFIETLNKTADQNAVDNEQVYKMANVLADDNGLKVMLTRLGAIQNVYRAKPLIQVLLKLFKLSVKVKKCQQVLIQPELGAMEVFLKTLQLCLENNSTASNTSNSNQNEPGSDLSQLLEQILDIMETILSKATEEQSMEEFEKFSQTFGGPEYITSLLKLCTVQPNVRNNPSVLMHLTRVLAALVYGNQQKMEILMNHFKKVLNFNVYDYEHTPDDQYKLEMFCVLTNAIERNAIGNTLKNYIISLGIVEMALLYITVHAPCVKPTLLRTDSDELKDFISRPALKYILRFLTGMAHSHENTQMMIAGNSSGNTQLETIIPIIHRLEQVSSDEHVGSLADDLLEALCTNEAVAKQIAEVRRFTRDEKKRLAMAMREKQLGQLGMRTNDKGQVTAKSTILQQMEELGEETGLVCCICREGYKYQPAKVLGIYTFTKRCNVEEFESSQRKTIGYSTVSHFNIVHVDCHMSAVRLARTRDEWESAALQNANTKCNGLLPLWGPQVPESAFASCLARHNTYLQESTSHRDIGHASTIHDLKLLLMRFALERSFHEDTGGGGPQSNMHMVPYLIHVALYVINTTRISKREETNLMAFLDNTNHQKWLESAYEAEGPLYWSTMSLLLHSPTQWRTHRLGHLKRLLVLAHMRHIQPSGGSGATLKSTWTSHRDIKDYSVYKPYLVFFGLIDGIYGNFFKAVTGSDDNWSNNLADYIRHNDENLMKASEKLLAVYTEELLPCTSFEEFCDVAGLLDVIENPNSYIGDLLSSIN